MRLEPSDEGTFLFPPARYTSVAAYAEFWAKVPISDGILANVTAGYAKMIHLQKTLEEIEWVRSYDRAHKLGVKGPASKKMMDAYIGRPAACAAHLAEWHKPFPEGIKADMVRNIARAGQVSFFRSAFDPAGQAEIMAWTILVGDEYLSVLDVEKRYQLGCLRPYFQDPDRTAAALEVVRVERPRMQGV